jgi:rhamnosyltransferase
VISVVIPVKNGGPDLRRCLDAIALQRVDDEVEVVVVDSGSSDGSVEVARAAGARVHEIPPAEFNHGGTRNLGASLARGDKLVFTSQDAHAEDPDWLAALTAPLDDPRVAGAYGRQIAHEDASPSEQFFLDFLYGPAPRVQRAADRIGPADTLFSNVNAAIRRDVFERFPFVDDIVMSEDQEWSARVLRDGYALHYVPRAVVRHSHPYTLRQAFRRFYDSGLSARQSYLVESSVGDLARLHLAYPVREIAWLVRTRQLRWIPRAVAFQLVKGAGVVLGVAMSYRRAR